MGRCLVVVPPPEDPALERSLSQFRSIVEASGRAPDSVGVAVASAPADPDLLEKYREQGVERAVVWVDPADDPATGMSNLHEVAKALGKS